MFRGRYEHSIDHKGRLSIPSKFREVLTGQDEEKLIVTNFDHCLWAYPLREWREVENKVAALPQFKPEVKALQRFFVSAACECPVDANGRVIIPGTLRDYADLKKNVVLVGMTKRIEIWAEERWVKIFEAAEQELSSLGDKLADLGL